MMGETTPRTSARWKPTTTFAAAKEGLKLDGEAYEMENTHIEDSKSV